MDGICGPFSTLEHNCSPHPGLVASRGRLVGTECGASQSWSFKKKLKRRYDGQLFHVEVGTPLLELPETLVPLEASFAAKGHSKWIGIFGNLSQEMTKFGGWCRQFQVEKPEEKREGPSGESVFVAVEGGKP